MKLKWLNRGVSRTNRVYLTVVAALVVLVCLPAAPVSGGTYYVATTGDNGDSGLSPATAWRTITYGATQAEAGDTVKIKGGNYGSEYVVIQNSGTAANPIVLEGYGGTPLLDGGGGGGTGIVTYKPYITMTKLAVTGYSNGIYGGVGSSNITLSNITAYENFVGANGNGICFSQAGDNIVISNCTAYNNAMCNYSISGSSANCLIENCEAYNTEGLGNYADYHYIMSDGANNNTIKDCTAGGYPEDDHHWAGHGFVFRHGASNNKVIGCTSIYSGCEHFGAKEDSEYNEFINCIATAARESAWVRGFQITASHNKVINCTVVDAGTGIYIRHSAAEPSMNLPVRDNLFINNITVNNISGISRSLPNTDPITNKYNDVWGNTTNYSGGCSAGTGDISVDPLFADEDNGDFHLLSTAGRWLEGTGWVLDESNSPCIDVGDPGDDYSSEAWYHGYRINMGAYGNTPYSSKTTAVDATWSGAAGADWDTAGNWTPTGVPAASDTVYVLTGTPSDTNGISVLGGSITISNAGTVLTYNTGGGGTFGAFLVGSSDLSGTVEINTGGKATGNRGDIGYYDGTGTGYVKVTGDGSAWDMTGLLQVSYANSTANALDVLDGGDVTAGSVRIGERAAGVGTVTVSGAGSTFTSSSYINIGNIGTGTLNVTDGGVVESSTLAVGSTGSGTVVVSAGGTLNTTSTGSSCGAIRGNGSTLTVTGAGSTWNAGGRVMVALGGTGKLVVSDKGEVNIGGELKMYYGANATLNCVIAADGFTKIEVGTLTVTASGTILDMGGEANTVRGAWYDLLSGASTATSRANLVLHANDVMVDGVGWDIDWDLSGTPTLMATYYETAVDATWSGAAGADWDTAGNWTPAGAPAAADTLYVLTGTPSDTNGISVLGGSITISNAGTVLTYNTGGGGTFGAFLVGSSDLSGTVEINTGGKATGNRGDIGYYDGTGTGHVKVTGDGSAWDMTGLLQVSYANSTANALDVLAGGDVTAGSVRIGERAAGVGTVTVSGAGSTFTSSSYIVIGNLGTGTLNVTDGGVVESSTLTVGSTGSGTVVVSAGGTLNTTSTGSGCGRISGTDGTVTVTGAGSTWNAGGRVLVGINGHGTLVVSDKGEVNIGGELKMYNGANATLNCVIADAGFTKIEVGTLTVTASGAILDMGGEASTVRGAWYDLLSGASSAASRTNLVLDAGDVMAAGVGWEIDWDLVTGGTTTLMATYRAAVDYTWSGAAAADWDTGGNWTPAGPPLAEDTVNVLTGTPSDTNGINVIGGYITIRGASTVVTYDTGAGSTFGLRVGNGNESGTLEIDTGGEATGTKGTIGCYGGTGTGYVKVTGDGSEWNMTGLLLVGYANTGTLDVLAGGDVTAGSATLGDRVYCTSENPGTATVSGAGSTLTSTGALTVGNFGTGVLNITAGADVTSGSAVIGDRLFGVGTVTVSGAGSTLTSSGALSVGDGGTGILNVTASGDVESVQLFIGQAAGGLGTVEVSAGGVLDTTSAGSYCAYIGNNGDGTLTVTGTGSTWDAGGRVLIGLHGAGTLVVSDNGEVNIDGELKMYNGDNVTLNFVIADDVGGGFTVVEASKITVTASGTILDMGGEDNTVLDTWYPLLTATVNAVTAATKTNLVLHPDDVIDEGVGWDIEWGHDYGGGGDPDTLSATYVHVPEPATLALLGLGGLGVLLRRRRA